MPSLRKATSAVQMMSGGSVTTDAKWALLFDCDGVIVETEELHRLAYNGAFEAFDLKVCNPHPLRIARIR
eukprot:3799839-Rhodomonas_salina.1